MNESDLVRDASASREVFNRLRDQGVRLTLDNFGSTTSALALLRDHPFDTVKIDRSFLAKLETGHEASEFIRAALRLVDSLGMVNVAQGVDNVAQLALLETLGCACAQGGFVGMPLPMARIVSVEDLKRSSETQGDGAPETLTREAC